MASVPPAVPAPTVAAAPLAPLVGRENETALLLDRWQRTKSGDGQVVLLAGEPGIGKSRLSAALQERIASEPHRVTSATAVVTSSLRALASGSTAARVPGGHFVPEEAPGEVTDAFGG